MTLFAPAPAWHQWTPRPIQSTPHHSPFTPLPHSASSLHFFTPQHAPQPLTNPLHHPSPFSLHPSHFPFHPPFHSSIPSASTPRPQSALHHNFNFTPHHASPATTSQLPPATCQDYFFDFEQRLQPPSDLIEPDRRPNSDLKLHDFKSDVRDRIKQYPVCQPHAHRLCKQAEEQRTNGGQPTAKRQKTGNRPVTNPSAQPNQARSATSQRKDSTKLNQTRMAGRTKPNDRQDKWVLIS